MNKRPKTLLWLAAAVVAIAATVFYVARLNEADICVAHDGRFDYASRQCVRAEPSAAAESWDRVVTGLPADPGAAAQILNDAYRGRGLPLTFWPNSGIPDSALRDLDIAPGPCGAEAFVQSPTIPPHDDRLVGEVIAELDSTGRILRRWEVPSNSSPVALRGDSVVIYLPVRDRGDLGLAIREDGRYAVVPVKRLSHERVVDCPPHDLFRNSALARCLEFTDAPRRRLLLYQGPCT